MCAAETPFHATSFGYIHRQIRDSLGGYARPTTPGQADSPRDSPHAHSTSTQHADSGANAEAALARRRAPVRRFLSVAARGSTDGPYSRSTPSRNVLMSGADFGDAAVPEAHRLTPIASSDRGRASFQQSVDRNAHSLQRSISAAESRGARSARHESLERVLSLQQSSHSQHVSPAMSGIDEDEETSDVVGHRARGRSEQPQTQPDERLAAMCRAVLANEGVDARTAEQARQWLADLRRT